MLLKKFSITLFAVLCLLPLRAFATTCACCAEQGYYSISTRKPDKYIFDELSRLKFTTAELYTDAGYPDTIVGIKPLGESFSVNASLANSGWKFNFKGNASKPGVLDLMKPVSMVEYLVDLTPTEEGEPARMVSLYKEWRFKYQLKGGNGIFQNGFAPKTEYFLVLQGRGNMCSSAEDFSNWRLEITGKKAGYAFFGSLGLK